MNRTQFEAKCRAALFWAAVFVVGAEYICRDTPFGEPEWLGAGIVLACLGVLFGRAYLAGAVSEATNRVHVGKLSSALARLGVVSLGGLIGALVLGWRAETPLVYNVSVAIGDFAFGLFVLWTEFWFRRLAGEEDAEPAVRK